MRKWVCWMVLLGLFASAAPAAVSEARVQQLKDLRWGMFVCWSFSTFSGKEWTPGVTNVNFFQSTEVDTDQWAKTAKEAEMGYLLFLTKHHDGFCLWDTKTTDRKVTKAPLGRDVLAEMRKSCDRHGIKLALYFSEGDWTWEGSVPGRKSGPNPEMKKAQLKELLTQYGPIEYIWMDHAVGDGGLSHEETVAWCKQFQPDCFIGFNHGPPAGDIRLGEMGKPGPLEAVDAVTIGSEQRAAHMRGYRGYRLAEFTYPILPNHEGGAQWFYSLPQHDQLVWPASRLYRDYLGAVKYGNIFSLDVGPDYRGRLREIDVTTLRAVGEMIRHPPPPPPQVKASSVWNAPGFEPELAVDGTSSTRWGAAPDARSGWLEVDLGASGIFRRAVIEEGAWDRVRAFELQYDAEGTWKTAAAGERIGPRRELTFSPVTARKFRLLITESADVPTICEFAVHGE